jgi:pyruvate dehydrogenase E2 component (dihydrolipoamide acetyltransferase)
MYGVDGFTPIINPPEIAILGLGRLTERPVVREGRLQVGHTLFLCLTFDHRAVDGAEAAGFLQTLKSILERPQMLLL